jgi:hypothetical protein
VKVEPLMGRVVLFSAAHMLHRVLPSKKKRLCFTTWFFAKSAAGDDRPAEGASAGAGAGGATGGDGDDKGAVEGRGEAGAVAAAVEEARALLRPHLRKHLMKVVFAQEWADSIAAAHPESPGRGCTSCCVQVEFS